MLAARARRSSLWSPLGAASSARSENARGVAQVLFVLPQQARQSQEFVLRRSQGSKAVVIPKIVDVHIFSREQVVL